MTQLDPRQQALHRAIGEVLHYRWDPLGVADDPAARTEYETYAGQVFSKVRAGASAEAIAAYLTAVTVEAMGLTPAPDHDATVARLVLAWRDELGDDAEASSASAAVPAPVSPIAATVGDPRRRGLTLTSVWSDESMLEFRVEVCDGTSSFVNEVYAGFGGMEEDLAALRYLLGRPEGGECDLAFGDVDRTWSGGGFRARFRFVLPGRLLVSCEQTSAPDEVGATKVSNSASVHFRSEPALLDRFVRELAAVAGGHRMTAYLEGV